MITQITAGRKKRDVTEDDDYMMQFVEDGGVDALNRNLPNVLVPLMVCYYIAVQDILFDTL